MSTARLTWVVLDRLVPSDQVADAKAALIARDPELSSYVAQGIMSLDEAVEAFRSRQSRYGDARRPIPWVVPTALLFLVGLIVWLVIGGLL
jgi:hypothetical protein